MRHSWEFKPLESVCEGLKFLTLSKLNELGSNFSYKMDQVTVKMVYSEEANQELMKIIDSRRNLLGLDAKGVRESDKEAIQAMYSLTRVLDEDKKKISSPIF